MRDELSYFVDPVIQIPNGTHQVIVQVSDPNTILLVLVTIGLAVVTGILAGITYKGNRDSNYLLRLDIKNRMKPLLVIEKVTTGEIPNLGGDGLSYFHIIIKNEGMVTARKIKMKIMPTNNSDIENLVKELKPENGGIQLGTLTKNGKTTFFRVIEKQGNNHIALWFDFTYLKKESERTVAIIHFTPNNVPQEYSLPTWYDQEDIEEAEKRHKDTMGGKISA